jgi:CRP-like cAMP-binding protein
VIAVLDENHFFGEGCLVGQPHRMVTASALAACSIVVVDKPEMVRQLREQPAFADRFLTHMLTRNIRIEEDLIDQLFNSSEKRLARALLLLARYGTDTEQHELDWTERALQPFALCPFDACLDRLDSPVHLFSLSGLFDVSHGGRRGDN